jgi:multiple sugar transport system substrate-binding protein
MSTAAEDKDLKPFLDELLLSELYPVGKTSWASVSADVKKRIGQAVVPGGSPAEVLGQIQATAMRAGSAE